MKAITDVLKVYEQHYIVATGVTLVAAILIICTVMGICYLRDSKIDSTIEDEL